jgi:hypothetical protein
MQAQGGWENKDENCLMQKSEGTRSEGQRSES